MTENKGYLTKQLITCIGNKRKLLGPIIDIMGSISEELGRKLDILDMFSGSGVVSRAVRPHARTVIANDLERFSQVVNNSFLVNHSEKDLLAAEELCKELNALADKDEMVEGFISKLYAPKDDVCKEGERCFYTTDNAKRLDSFRQWLVGDPAEKLLLGPLLAAASIHTNTAGIFKSYYKKDGIGHFGGKGEDALARIKGKIELSPPVQSNFNVSVSIFREDAMTLAPYLPHVDVAYLDPPYNQHPYGSNYFMLNLLADYVEPYDISRVSGIPKDWNRSNYYKKDAAKKELCSLLETVKASYVLLSYSNEGFIPREEIKEILEGIGTLISITDKRHNVFRGSRNFNHRPTDLTEQFFLLKK